MKFSKGQIIKINIETGPIYGRVTSVDENGDGEAMFKSGFSIVKSGVMPEMVIEAFWHNGTGRYGV